MKTVEKRKLLHTSSHHVCMTNETLLRHEEASPKLIEMGVATTITVGPKSELWVPLSAWTFE